MLTDSFLFTLNLPICPALLMINSELSQGLGLFFLMARKKRDKEGQGQNSGLAPQKIPLFVP